MVLAVLARRMRAYTLLTMTAVAGLGALALLILALPVRIFIGLKAWRQCSSAILKFAVPAFLLPAALSGTIIRVNEEHWKMIVHSRTWAPISIVMCNHASRIDWLLALWCGNATKPIRVSFLAEGTMQFMPIVGWLCKMCEDIFLWRSFKVDKGTIDANINSFKATGTQRSLFLAIEGAIVDQGLFDKQYMADCAAFCTQQGYEPFEYVLTPRYKGIHSLAQHAGSELFAATMCFTRDGQVTVHFDRLEISADQDKAKLQCMNNYKYRDGMISHFHQNGRYPGGKKNVRFLFYIFPPVFIFFGWPIGPLARRICSTRLPMLLPYLSFLLFITLALCHSIGQFCAGGVSRESLPFETIFKAYFYAGRDEKVKELEKRAADKKRGSASSPGEAISETAKMLNLMSKFPAN
ncbi:hypothetical protein T492DRAFT_1067552 [Pavlovales sp. CCMP2436]|nr:hypothetical protein T492DRAFT_1067552 [Pavlovales sp. CCMP2436]